MSDSDLAFFEEFSGKKTAVDLEECARREQSELEELEGKWRSHYTEYYVKKDAVGKTKKSTRYNPLHIVLLCGLISLSIITAQQSAAHRIHFRFYRSVNSFFHDYVAASISVAGDGIKTGYRSLQESVSRGRERSRRSALSVSGKQETSGTVDGSGSLITLGETNRDKLERIEKNDLVSNIKDEGPAGDRIAARQDERQQREKFVLSTAITEKRPSVNTKAGRITSVNLRDLLKSRSQKTVSLEKAVDKPDDQRIPFTHNSSAIIFEEQHKKLSEILNRMSEIGTLSIILTGYAGDTFDSYYNKRLAANRLQAVAGYLISCGISEDRIKKKSLSEGALKQDGEYGSDIGSRCVSYEIVPTR